MATSGTRGEISSNEPQAGLHFRMLSKSQPRATLTSHSPPQTTATAYIAETTTVTG